MVLMQDSKKGMSQALTGGSSDNFFQKNSGRTKEARLAKATRTAAILFFVVTLIVNVFAVYFKESEPEPDWGSMFGLEGDGWQDITGDFDWDSMLADDDGHVHDDDHDGHDHD